MGWGHYSQRGLPKTSQLRRWPKPLHPVEQRLRELLLNPDPYCRFIGPKNWGEALIDEELMTCLLDNGSQLNFITPAYAHKQGMDIMSLDSLAQEVGGKLPPILGIGGIMVDPEGFIMMNVKVPCVNGVQ